MRKLKKRANLDSGLYFNINSKLIYYAGISNALPVLPVFSAKLGGSDAWAGLVIGIFTISAVLMRPIAGQYWTGMGEEQYSFQV